MSKIIDLHGRIDVFLITNGRSTFKFSKKTVEEQVGVKFKTIIHENMDWLTANVRMVEVSDAKYCLRVDDDMFLNKHALRFMWYCLKKASDQVALRGWRLWEPWSDKMCKGIKVYNRGLVKNIGFRLDKLGKVDKPFTHDAEKLGYDIDYSRDICAIHAAGKFEEHLRYWEMRGETKNPVFKKKSEWAKNCIEKHSLSLQEQYEMSDILIPKLNKKYNNNFYRWITNE